MNENKGWFLGFIQGLTVACTVATWFFLWQTQKNIEKTRQTLKETQEIRRQTEELQRGHR